MNRSHHLHSRRERMAKTLLRSLIATPTTGQVKMPAPAKVALRAVGGGGGSPVTCTYTFNSDNAFATGFGFTGAVEMVSPQVGRLIVEGNTTKELLTTNSALATVDYTVGSKVVEIEFTSSAAQLVSTSALAAAGFIVVNTATSEILAGVSYWVTSDGIELNVVRFSTLVGTVTVGTNAVVGFRVNSDNTFNVLVNGVPVILSDNTITTANLILVLELVNRISQTLRMLGLLLLQM